MLAGVEDLNQGNAVFYGRARFNGTHLYPQSERAIAPNF